ncbi:MAG: PIN domain-containing protein [Chloroflexota bacterium]|nr:PIN domain-containing protein [Chloroflexota bacterium]
MAALLLDTTVLIDLRRGRPSARARIEALRASGDTPYICAINVEETVRGLRPSEEDAARALLGGLRLVPLGDAEGWRSGEWRRSFAASGRTLSQADWLVAAAALTIGGRLATGNPKDFPMAGIDVEHWPSGT